MNTSEYNQCVAALSDNLYRFAWKSLGTSNNAKDIVQQAFMTLWERREDVSTEKAKSFLFTIAYRKCMDIHRTGGRTVSAEEFPENMLTENPKSHDLKKVLQNAINLLDQQSKDLVLLKDYEGYSYEEIAKITNLSTTQVKVYLHRARKVLKNYLVSREHLI